MKRSSDRSAAAARNSSRARAGWQHVVLLALLLACACGVVHAQAELSAVPNAFTAGAKIKVNVQGLALNTTYRLRLEDTDRGGSEYDLQDFSSGSSTTATRAVLIPAAPSGSYMIVLYRVSLGTTQLAFTNVTVGTSSSLTLSPASAPPGRRVTLTANNLVAGSLRVSYAGKTLFGPVAVGAGTYSRSFVVPSDRPANFPASVPVVAENMAGRLVVKRGTANFQALAPSNALRLGFQQPVVPATQIKPSSTFPVSGRLLDDAGLPPTGRNQLYFIGGGVTVPVDTQVQVAGDGTLQMQARAPSEFFDGISATADRTGNLVIVNQGGSRDTDANRDGQYGTQTPLVVAVDGRDAADTSFTVVVRRFQSGGGGALVSGAIVEADAAFQTGFVAGQFTKGSMAGQAMQLRDEQVLMSSTPNQTWELDVLNLPQRKTENYGCDVTFFRKITNGQGVAGFVISPDTIANINFNDIAEEFLSCNIPPCSDTKASPSAKGADFSGRAQFVMTIHGAHLGLRNHSVALEYDGDTGNFTSIETGQVLVNDVLEVALEPMQEDDFDLRDVRIDGVGPPERKQPGQCTHGQAGECYFVPYRYQSMFVYPDEAKWPANLIVPKNNGRKVRLEVDPAIYGPLTSGRIRIGNTAWADFAGTQAPPTCLLDATPEVAAGKVEYVASLPDLTRLPAGEIPGVVELRFGSAAPRSFDIVLSTVVPKVDDLNPNVKTMAIDALRDVITGTYDTPDLDIPVDSPGHDVGPMDSITQNEGDFDLRRGAEGAAINVLESTTDNDVAGNPGGLEAVTGAFFGFTDGTHLVPATTVLFDTGLIPLFRYSFGVAPIAAATLGADLWMAATLQYYGELRPEGMNATIDPRVAGGVNLFFDLDLLFGIVSGSISAESEMGLSMRAKINQGGKAHLPGNPSPPQGECFTFDLDGVWEACAAGICGGGRESLITVREPQGCAASKQSPLGFDGQGMLADKAGVHTRNDFDLARPKYTASALGGDGRGHAISIGVNAAGAIVATHISGGVVTDTNTVASATVGVQHMDVAFFAPDRAVAVWSENSRTLAQVTDLMQTQRGRAFDDLARTQSLRYSTWDGARWTLPQALTTGGSDGKPQLAGCLPPPRRVLLNCPSSGEVTAVWERDANANLDSPDLEIWSSRYSADGRGWSTPVRVSSSGISSDMLPSVAYRNNVPVVAWARNPGGAFVDLSKRQLAYRFLDGSAQQIATELGTGVGWVDVGVSNADAVVMAYTRAQDPLGFVGNRQALYSARASTCPSGVCDFLVTEVRDPSARQYRVERPRVSFDENDTPVIGFRALAFGPNALGKASQAGDLPGIMLGTGELGVVRVHSYARPTYRAHLIGLSDNALQHWKPDFIYDETMGGLLAVSMQAVAPPGFSEPFAVAKILSPEGSPFASKGVPLGDGGELRTAMAGPDFIVREARLSRSVVASGQALQLDATLDNIGANYVLAEHGSVKVIASLDGPAGSGTALGTFTVATDQASNASRVVSLSLALPAGVRADERHTVFIDIEADELADANDSTADHARIEVNAMPVPTLLNGITREGSPTVSLTWQDPLDARVHGWRVWKLAPDGSWQHLGSTRQLGYLDITAVPGQASSYRVASYSANGMESEPSAAMTVSVVVPKGVGIFGSGFESGAP